jgi:hypothetical protein
MPLDGTNRAPEDRNEKAAHAGEPPFRVSVGDLRLGPKERSYVNEVLDSSRLSYGPFSQRFESLFA